MSASYFRKGKHRPISRSGAGQASEEMNRTGEARRGPRDRHPPQEGEDILVLAPNSNIDAHRAKEEGRDNYQQYTSL